MLHLAQVQKNESVGGVKLRLIARQQSENCWALINPESVMVANTNSLNEEFLVLVELSDTQEVLSIKPAKDWVLEFIQEYLTIGITPKLLQEEVKLTEEWRRDLTSQSQDLTRQRAEMEARRDRIQSLEQELGPEKQRLLQQLEETEAKLKAAQAQLEKANELLAHQEAQLNQLKRQQQIEEE
ncbi:MAG TPA: hypothetical protein DDZ80_30190 [Cyanobacteria bacterium UBA8803]|nr:hypothetical protein [Cyanobacteria bacterium UBA9273]HBL62504.1 hypothetical protein [Cyanobacteria bacterium UBA8803]